MGRRRPPCGAPCDWRPETTGLLDKSLVQARRRVFSWVENSEVAELHSIVRRHLCQGLEDALGFTLVRARGRTGNLGASIKSGDWCRLFHIVPERHGTSRGHKCFVL